MVHPLPAPSIIGPQPASRGRLTPLGSPLGPLTPAAGADARGRQQRMAKRWFCPHTQKS
jgi:hypothetical protein